MPKVKPLKFTNPFVDQYQTYCKVKFGFDFNDGTHTIFSIDEIDYAVVLDLKKTKTIEQFITMQKEIINAPVIRTKIEDWKGEPAKKTKKELKQMRDLFNNTVGEVIKPITYTIWYDCFIPDKPKFGFSVDSKGIITSFNDRNMVGNKLTDHRNWFINNKATVVKVAEQIEK